MTRKEASYVAVGDKLIYKGFYTFVVKNISYVEPCNMARTAIYFHDGKESFLHRYCRRYGDNK